MAELIPSRADQYPEPDDRDVASEIAVRLIDHVPIANLVADIVLPRFFIPAINRRRDEWFKELASDLSQLEDRVEHIFNDEAFISASIQATHIAVATHQREKRQYLRNALLNIAEGKRPDETKQQIFLNAIEAFSPAHVRALNVIWRGPGLFKWDDHGVPIARRNYGAAIEIFVSEVKGQPSLIAAVLTDLRNRGFSTLDRADYPFPAGSLMTNLGVEFLNFVLSPDELPQK